MTNGNAPLMKDAHTRLYARYLAALRTHLGHKSLENGDSAQGLGRAALAGGLATLDLAVMHEQAVFALAASHDFASTHNGVLKQAGYFFTQALIPLEAAQRATRETNRHLQQHNETLRLHTAALASGNLRLEREVARRKAGEGTIRKGKAQYKELFLKSQVMQRKLRQLTRQIISAQEDERKQISRELHDGVVQTLIGINVELAALGEGAAVGRQALKAKIARTQRLVTNSVNAVHRFARELRPAVLDDLGLIPALHAYNKSLAARKKIKIKLTAFGGVEAMGSAKRTVLFRVAQEALTNVARHAQATQVRMSITEISGAIRMEISDNGKSFQVDKILSAKNHKRLGLVGMRERVEMVGGSLTIESVPGKGTTVRAEVPFTQEKTKK
ncbi:MAG TPA: sensor histidine kinase [Opitutaceae bacterium]|jgi:two-component system sensor histidine kinase DegS|nr:sensor histidine kinase [Opitutaceae bacterium]